MNSRNDMEDLATRCRTGMCGIKLFRASRQKGPNDDEDDDDEDNDDDDDD